MPSGERPNFEGGQMPKNADAIISRLPEAPDGFEIAVVEIGIQGDDFTEIISGLKVGHKIYKQETSSSSSRFGMGHMGAMGGMSGGMRSMGGGMPSGMGPR